MGRFEILRLRNATALIDVSIFWIPFTFVTVGLQGENLLIKIS